MPSRRQSLLIFGGVGAAAAAGGVYAYENREPAKPYDPRQVTPPPRAVAPPAKVPVGDAVDWRPGAIGFVPANDKQLQIKAYASATSVNRGESIDFHVSVSPAQKFTVQVFRLGRAADGGASKLMTTSPVLDGTTQSAPTVVAPTRTVVTEWDASWKLDVPQDWKSGLYIATFSNEQKFRNCVPFVVRDDGATTDLLVVLPFTTYQAYNIFPHDNKVGSDLYHAWDEKGTYGGPEIASTTVSFDRPFADNGLPSYFDLDYGFVDWVETQDYTVSYATSVDLHAGRVDHTKHKAMVFSGHDEYWSPQMRDALDAAIAGGTSAAFLAANNIYWAIRFEPSAAGVEDRQVVCYKGRQAEDPQKGQSGHLPTGLWRDNGRPEQQVLGGMYVSVVLDQKPQPLVVDNADHWVWKGTGVRNGEQIPNMIAGEADQVRPGLSGSPAVTYLGVSPFTGNGRGAKPERMLAHTTLHQTKSGAWVFDAGTFYWPYGLSSPAYVDSRIQGATKNLLDRMTGKSA